MNQLELSDPNLPHSINNIAITLIHSIYQLVNFLSSHYNIYLDASSIYTFLQSGLVPKLLEISACVELDLHVRVCFAKICSYLVLNRIGSSYSTTWLYKLLHFSHQMEFHPSSISILRSSSQLLICLFSHSLIVSSYFFYSSHRPIFVLSPIP